MQVGDKVRVLRGKEEGIITRIIDNKLIEIEIEDGFQIPVLKSEVVIVSKEESDYFKREHPSTPVADTAPTPVMRKAEEGVYLVFKEINDKVMAVYLVNATDYEVPYTFFSEERNMVHGISTGNMSPGAFSKITEVSTQNFENWPKFIINLLYFTRKASGSIKSPFTKKINFKAASFFKSKRKAPILDVEAFTFKVDEESKLIDAKSLQENLLKGKSNMYSKESKNDTPLPVVDLHIDKLTPDPSALSNAEMLELQLQTFEKYLDKAIEFGLNEVTFIHGVGNGILKNAIHKKLSKLDNISFFKEAQKEKFGHGATLVRIK